MRQLIPFKILQDKYQEAIEIEEELNRFRIDASEETVLLIKNKQQKDAFLSFLKRSADYNFDDNFLSITNNLILVIIYKLQQFLSEKITRDELVLFLRDYIESNVSFFKDGQTIKLILYLIDNFPDPKSKSQKLISWVNKLEVDEKQYVQIICYLFCSFHTTPLDSLRLQMSIMPYLENFYSSVSRAGHTFILFPFVYEYWSIRLSNETESFNYSSSLEENLKKSIDVKREYKVISVFATICMLLSYTPNSTELDWFRKYLDYMMK